MSVLVLSYLRLTVDNLSLEGTKKAIGTHNHRTVRHDEVFILDYTLDVVTRHISLSNWS